MNGAKPNLEDISVEAKLGEEPDDPVGLTDEQEKEFLRGHIVEERGLDYGLNA